MMNLDSYTPLRIGDVPGLDIELPLRLDDEVGRNPGGVRATAPRADDNPRTPPPSPKEPASGGELPMPREEPASPPTKKRTDPHKAAVAALLHHLRYSGCTWLTIIPAAIEATMISRVASMTLCRSRVPNIRHMRDRGVRSCCEFGSLDPVQ
jgi:hypothetical protein